MGTALRAGIGGAVGGALCAGLAMAVKGGAELNAAVTQFAADTGATTEEAAKAQSTIGELFRTNLQSFGEIGGTLAVLRTDLGLTQDAADQAAQSYLDFAQVAGGTGAEAAGRFDDLLDALNLDAAKAPGIMDQLVASHQRYGELDQRQHRRPDGDGAGAQRGQPHASTTGSACSTCSPRPASTPPPLRRRSPRR